MVAQFVVHMHGYTTLASRTGVSSMQSRKYSDAFEITLVAPLFSVFAISTPRSTTDHRHPDDYQSSIAHDRHSGE